MSGRPPSTIEGEVRAAVRRLRGVSGDMDPLNRLAVIAALSTQLNRSVRYTGAPDTASLVRLAAHAQVWAEELQEAAGDGTT